MIKLTVPGYVIDQFSEIVRKATVAKGRMMNRQKPLTEAKDYMVQRWDINFSGQGSIYGDWPELNEDWTVVERGSSAPILVRTGGLFAHFVDQNESGQVDASSVLWEFSNADGAWTVSHHDGYPNPIAGHASIPARRLWDFNGEDEEHIRELFEVWCEEVINSIF